LPEPVEPREERARRERRGSQALDVEQMTVSGNDRVRAGGSGQRDEVVVLRIGLDDSLSCLQF